MTQIKPLVQPKPLEQHVAAATTPSSMNLQLGIIDLENVNVAYGNDVSTFYTKADIGKFVTKERSLDLTNNKINLDEISLSNSTIATRLGKTHQAKVVKQEAKKEAKAQKQAGWNVIVSRFDLANNSIQYDDDNKAAQRQGIDYSHISAEGVTLYADSFFMSPDSIAVNIRKGAVKEKSGLNIEQLQGEILYANNQAYLQNFYVKTPGTEIKRGVVLNYPSMEALTKHPDKVNFQVNLVQTKIQVKDVLLFAPQFRTNPALKNPNDVWKVNLVGSGTMNQFNFESLQFAGLAILKLMRMVRSPD